MKNINKLVKKKDKLYGSVGAVQLIPLPDDIHVSGMENLKAWLKSKKDVFFASDDILKYYHLREYVNIIEQLSNKFNTYIYLPSILKPNFKNLFKDTIEKALNKYIIKGFVISNIGYLDMLEEYKKDYEF